MYLRSDSIIPTNARLQFRYRTIPSCDWQWDRRRHGAGQTHGDHRRHPVLGRTARATRWFLATS